MHRLGSTAKVVGGLSARVVTGKQTIDNKMSLAMFFTIEKPVLEYIADRRFPSEVEFAFLYRTIRYRSSELGIASGRPKNEIFT